MSAFVVSHDHIDALLTFARDKRLQSRLSYFIDRQAPKPLGWSAIGAVLLTENERSVCHRYSDCVPGNCPGKIGEVATGYHFRPFEQFSLMSYERKCVWVIKGCNCFDYQACETDDYAQSTACQLIEQIRAAAIRALPGYEDAPWGIERARKEASNVLEA